MNFNGVLLCTDLDGTLLRNDKSISKKNIEAIEYFKAHGGMFTIVTGRMPFYVQEICEIVKPNVPFGCINGGGVYDNAKQEYTWTYPLGDAVHDILDDVQRQFPEMGIFVSCFEKGYFSKDSTALAWFRKVTNMPNLVCAHRDVPEAIAKIMFGHEDEKQILALKAFLDAHRLADKFSFVRSEKMLYEILPKGSSKALCLEKMTEYLNVTRQNVIAIGDYHNDIAMLKFAGTGVAVANAQPEVQAVSDYITVSNEENAIAQVIADIENGIIAVGSR